MTDREMILATYTALEEVYFQLAGKPLEITIKGDDGQFIKIRDFSRDTLTHDGRLVQFGQTPAVQHAAP